jgi:hypothetical protein
MWRFASAIFDLISLKLKVLYSRSVSGMVAGMVGVIERTTFDDEVASPGSSISRTSRTGVGETVGREPLPTTIGVGVGAIRAGVGIAFGVLSVITTFTGVGVGSTPRICPFAVIDAAAKSEIIQKTTLVIMAKLGELILVWTGCELPAFLRFAY